jgi:hypothetical protein
MANQDQKVTPTATQIDEKTFAPVQSVQVKASASLAPPVASKSSKSKFVKLPNGTRLRPYLIAQCSPTDKGVSILNSGGNMIGFIDTLDATEKQIVMDLLDDCANDNKKFVQPDWSFLNS